MNAITWVRKRAGSYESNDGRFTIIYNPAAKQDRRWGLFDRQSRDALLPQYNRSSQCYSLRNAKSTAERWLRGRT